MTEAVPFMLLSVFAILFVAALVQGILGFAMAVVAIPLLVWIGMPMSEAVALSGTSTMIQAFTGMIKLRQAIPWSDVVPATVIRLAILPIGILGLVWLNEIPVANLKATLGVCIIILVALKLSLRIPPRDSLPKPWNYTAFAASGLLAGAIGMGGPPLVLWISALRWDNDKVRAFLFANFALLSPVSMVLMIVAFGWEILPSIGLGLLGAPIVVLGSLMGVRIGTSIPQSWFRRTLLAALIALGLASILAAVRG